MRFAFWNPHGLPYLFLAEAKRIWELQVVSNRHRSLTSVQAVVLINVIYNICGLDKIGDVYGLQGFALAQEIGLFDGNAHTQSRRLRDATDFTAWGLFNLSSHLAWQFFRRSYLEPPSNAELPDPIAEAAWYGEVWMRYPTDQYVTPSYYGLFFRAICQFRVILNDICNVAFSSNSKITVSQVRAAVLYAPQPRSNGHVPQLPLNQTRLLVLEKC